MSINRGHAGTDLWFHTTPLLWFMIVGTPTTLPSAVDSKSLSTTPHIRNFGRFDSHLFDTLLTEVVLINEEVLMTPPW